MISFKRYLSCLEVLIFSLVISSCGTLKAKTGSISLPDYSDIAVLELKQNDSNIYSIKDNSLIKMEDAGAVSQIEYNTKYGVYAYLNNINFGNNLIQNRIEILSRAGESKISNFFSARDIKLSPDASRLLFRDYDADSLQSAEGMKIYNISSRKYLNFKSKVLVSGNLYEWLNENEVIYYGISSDGSTGGGIYKYNIAQNTEMQVFNEKNGYCTFLTTAGNSILYLEKSGDDCRLYCYNMDNGKKSLISTELGEVWEAVRDNRDNSLYIVASKSNEINSSVYKIAVGDSSLKRITYDFPKDVEKDGGIALSSEGILYFCGAKEDSQNEKDDIFSFSIKDGSVNIVSGREHTGKYIVFSDDSIKQP